MTATYMITSIDVADVTVDYHCSHKDGDVSYKVGGVLDGTHVYLQGNTTEMLTFAVLIATAARDASTAELRSLVAEVDAELDTAERKVPG